MATKKVTAHTTAVALFSTPEHSVGKISSINIDNQSGAQRTVRLQDIFTPDASVGQANPTLQTIERFQATVANGLSFSADEASLKDVKCLGDAKAIADDISTDCVVIVGYSIE